MKLKEVIKILNNIDFKHSCVDMGWKWKAEEIDGTTSYIDTYGKMKKKNRKGFLICCSFQRPDINTGAIGTGYGRWMWVNKDVDETRLIMTATICVDLIVKHEIMEAMLYKKATILNPHKNIKELVYPQKLKSKNN